MWEGAKIDLLSDGWIWRVEYLIVDVEDVVVWDLQPASDREATGRKYEMKE